MRLYTRYEHGYLRLAAPGGEGLSAWEWEALKRAHDPEDGYYELLHNGVRFRGKVGLLHFGAFAVEVLPKADEGHNENDWRRLLLAMMVRAGYFSAQIVEDAYARPGATVLDLLLGRYLLEVEAHLAQGLIKRYELRQGNVKALRGRLLFGRQLQQNLVHAERFFTEHTTYTFDHALNRILAAALAAVPRLARNPDLAAQARRLSLRLPEITERREVLVELARVRHDRKSAPFESSLRLAELILRNLHPDTQVSHKPIFSLMISMDRLWEAWLRAELQRAWPHIHVGKASGRFYRPEGGSWIHAFSDISLHKHGSPKAFAILDAKWKRLDQKGVSEQDLRQVFTYQHMFGGLIGGLVYPGNASIRSGSYWCDTRKCLLFSIPVVDKESNWKDELLESLTPSSSQLD